MIIKTWYAAYNFSQKTLSVLPRLELE